MKIRNGFVSNSSSSSFILKFDENYPDTLSIAKSMLNDKYAENEANGFSDNIKRSKIEKYTEALENENDPYMPIYFTSCNYNTYIVPVSKNYVFIETCNNTNWSIENNGIILNELPEEILERYPGSEGYGKHENHITIKGRVNQYNEPLSVIYDIEYFLIEHGVIMKAPKYYSTCKNCYSDLWYFNGVEYCMHCDRDKIMRGLKIKKIKSVFTSD